MAGEQPESSEILNNILEQLKKKDKGEPKDYITNSPYPERRKDKVNVYVRISIVRVGEIDTVRQEFQCEFYMRLRWEEEKLKDKDAAEKAQITWESMWHPRYHFINAVTLEMDETKKVFQEPRHKDQSPQIVFHCYIKGVFKEVLEMNNFPFDYQKLSLTLASKCHNNEMNFVKDTGQPDNIRTDNFYAPQEWKLCSHVVTEQSTSKETEGASKNRYPKYEMRMNVRRQYKFYIYNVFLVMFLITALTFANFAVEADIPGDRIQIALTLLLTSVAFKYYVQQFVPTVSYLTLIDKYILSSMVFQFLMVMHVIASGFLAKSSMLSTFEWTGFGIGVLIFAAINIYFGRLSLKCNKEAKDKEAEDKVKYIGNNPGQMKSSEEIAEDKQETEYFLETESVERTCLSCACRICK